ncbi:APC family permease [Sorangium sp. So ce117]|uniref:APC family permease n=1 Tax=Sorangium sp. So ce117 TaxID=3133277 RepID=UPI003F648A3E
MNPNSLRKTIGIYGAVTLAVGVVVGAGMLSLPGLVYREAGGWAPLSWLLDALLVIPLLIAMTHLARRFPSAGGVAGFVGEAFPSLRLGCSYLLVGTFSLGLPAIAITGGNYLASALGPGDTDALRLAGAGLGALFLLAVLAFAWLGARTASALQNVVVTALVLVLCLLGVLAALNWHRIDFSAGAPSPRGVWNGMALAFFAFTGWEMLAFTTEEFKNPRRDFPLAVAISFVIVLLLYLGAAFAVQALVDLDDPLLAYAPLLVAIERGTGAETSLLGAIVVSAIVLVNLNGACWAASRLIYDIGRQGWAPRRLGLTRLSGAHATPRPAVLALAALFAGVIGVAATGLLSLDDLLRLSGQNFFLLYTLAVVAYLRLATSRGARVFGVVALLACLIFMRVFGWGLLYAAGLFALPYAVRAASARWLAAR